MSKSVRVILFTSDEEYATKIRHDLLGIAGVKIVAEVDDTVLLAQATERFPADVAIVDLDPVPEETLPVAGALAMERPDLYVFALSESTDGQLILSAMRSGISEFLTKPLDFELIKLAFEKVASRKQAETIDGQLITIIGCSGGVGATSLACNLAVELVDLVGKGQVALVDLDYRFGQVATMLDIQANFTIGDLTDSAEQLETSVIERAMTKHDCGVHILARPNQFAQADMITAAHCAGILQHLQSMYRYVIVDGPNRFDLGSKCILDIADLTLLIVQLLVPSVRNVHRIVEGMREAGFNLGRIKVICNRVGKESGSISPEYVEETLNEKIFCTLPDDWPAVSTAINMGVPLKQEHSKSKIRLAIRELVEKIHNPEGQDEQKAVHKKGLLSKMFSKG